MKDTTKEVRENLWLSPGDMIPSIQFSVEGLIVGAQRTVNVSVYDKGFSIAVDAYGEFCVSSKGDSIWKHDQPDEWTQSDREIILGPVIVFALALKENWALHASAVMYNKDTIAFLAESGTGKSTLAEYLSRQMDWCLVADDILPITGNASGVTAWPRFPQLKLPVDAQPSVSLPEQLPLNILCELVPVDPESAPEIRRLPSEQAIKVLLSHTAGSRLFDEKMLEAHLAFCAQAAEIVPVYQLMYPRSRESLPKVKKLLENLC